MADTEELDQSEVVESTSPAPAAPQTPDLEAQIREALKSELDNRFSGFQSMTDKRFAQLAQELRKSSMTEDEWEDQSEQTQAQEAQRALQMAELIRRRKTHPEAVDFLLENMEKADIDEQLEFIQSVLKPAQPAVRTESTPASEAQSDEQEIPDSDSNRPAAPVESGEMNDELADTILNQVGRGQFSRFFKR